MGLLAKLSQAGINDTLLKWFTDYLYQRQQRVVVNGQSSTWNYVRAGVPQGSVLGPLLFLVYINDITTAIDTSEIRLFADDTILYMFIDNPLRDAASLNKDLANLSKWAQEWLVTFSPTKTKSMTITRKRVKINQPPPVYES